MNNKRKKIFRFYLYYEFTIKIYKIIVQFGKKLLGVKISNSKLNTDSTVILL